MKPYGISVICFLILALGLLTAGCTYRHEYPAGNPGWHSDDYSIVFGVLNEDPNNAANWSIRYAPIGSVDMYGGQFAIEPVDRLIGYSDGDLVEITGTPLPGSKNPAGTGSLYNMNGIRLWLNSANPSSLTR
jgi:hypothetical protein